jgi:hypothetical protein
MEQPTAHHQHQDRAASPGGQPVPPPVRPEQILLPLDEQDRPGRSDRDTPPAGPSAPAPSPATAQGEPAPDHDRPIGFALTARARRAVAPGSLPALRVVADGAGAASEGGGPLEEPDDTRPARARALRRAGVPVSAIASQLGADPLAVTAWVGEVAPSRRRRGGTTPATPATAGPSDSAGAVAPEPAVPPADDQEETAAQLARAAAASQARGRLEQDPRFALAVGLLAAMATVDRYAVTLTTDDARQAARALEAVREEAPEAIGLLRVVLRLGPSVAADLARHRVAQELGISAEQISWTRWRSAPRTDAAQLLARIGDPSVAASVAGWIDAVLEPSSEPVGLAF